MSDLVLSPSSLEAFRTCGWRWYLEYIEGTDQMTSLPQVIGLAVHAGAEAALRLRMLDDTATGDDEDEVAIDAFNLRWAFEIVGVDHDEAPNKAHDSALRTLSVYLSDVADQIDPVLVEDEVQLSVNGIEVSMHPDVFDAAANGPRDLKVKHAKPRDPGVYATQMNLQALGWRQFTGSKESDVFIDVMVRLKRDRPYHIPIRNGGPVTDFAIGLTVAQLERTANEIDAGRFPPTGLETGACKWCPVSHACVYWAEFYWAEFNDEGP